MLLLTNGRAVPVHSIFVRKVGVSVTSRQSDDIELVLFYNGTQSVDVAISSGIDAVIVDCEKAGKGIRQRGYDTEINRWEPVDCAKVRSRASNLWVICRIDSFREAGAKAIEQARIAVSAGAHEVILPMVDGLDEVCAVLDAVSGKAQVSIMIETKGAIAVAAELDRLPLRRAFLGLNDLMIETGGRHLFEHILNGTVERVRSKFEALAFGFGGMTLPEAGYPVPCRLMIAELARLRCNFTFLRRSFYRDLAATGIDPAEAAMRMRSAWMTASSRSAEMIAQDHAELSSILERIVSGRQS